MTNEHRPPCPRCGRLGIRDADSYWCPVCGTYAEQRFRESWDVPSVAGPTRPEHFRPWNEADDVFLVANLGTLTVDQLAAALNRTPRAVYSRLTYKGWSRRRAIREGAPA